MIATCAAGCRQVGCNGGIRRCIYCRNSEGDGHWADVLCCDCICCRNRFEEMLALLTEWRKAHEEAAAREERHRQFFLDHAKRQSAHELRLIEMEEMARKIGYGSVIHVIA